MSLYDFLPCEQSDIQRWEYALEAQSKWGKGSGHWTQPLGIVLVCDGFQDGLSPSSRGKQNKAWQEGPSPRKDLNWGHHCKCPQCQVDTQRVNGIVGLHIKDVRIFFVSISKVFVSFSPWNVCSILVYVWSFFLWQDLVTRSTFHCKERKSVSIMINAAWPQVWVIGSGGDCG